MSNGFIFTVKAYSPLHAGTGQSIGKVDLPIEREKHTEYPCVYATGLKGSMRCHSKGKLTDDQIKKIFGDEKGEEGAGNAVFTDMKLLLFPVRSSEGSFKYIISENVITRFQRDYKLIKQSDFGQSFGEIVCNSEQIFALFVRHEIGVQKLHAPRFERIQNGFLMFSALQHQLALINFRQVQQFA